MEYPKILKRIRNQSYYSIQQHNIEQKKLPKMCNYLYFVVQEQTINVR